MSTALFARSTGAPPGHSGVPANNPIDAEGRFCTRCHTPGASLTGGFIRLQAFHYKPAQRQTIRVTVHHPDAARWGFQLTARRASNLNERVGNFVASSEVQVFC